MYSPAALPALQQFGFLIILPGIGIVNLLTSHVVWDDETLTVAKLPFFKQTEAWRDLQRVLDSGGGMPLGSVTRDVRTR